MLSHGIISYVHARQCYAIHTLPLLFVASNEHQLTPIQFTLASQQRRQYAFTWFCNFDACHSNVFGSHNSSSGGARDWSFVQQTSITVRSCFQCSLLSTCRSFHCSLRLSSAHFCANINERQEVKVCDGLLVLRGAKHQSTVIELTGSPR